jgi:hypothetical protein
VEGLLAGETPLCEGEVRPEGRNGFSSETAMLMVDSAIAVADGRRCACREVDGERDDQLQISCDCGVCERARDRNGSALV